MDPFFGTSKSYDARRPVTPRPAPRYPYQGKILLLVPFSPWRLLLTLTGIDLSTSGVRACLQAGARASMADAAALLVEGDAYELQLEPDSGQMPAPFVSARLLRVRPSADATSLEVTLTFAEPDAGLFGLVNELVERGAQSQ